MEQRIDRLVESTWGAQVPADSYHEKILQVAQRVAVDEMMRQAASDGNSNAVKGVLADRLDKIAAELEGGRSRSAHQSTAAADIRRWQAHPAGNVPAKALAMPPGDPI